MLSCVSLADFRLRPAFVFLPLCLFARGWSLRLLLFPVGPRHCDSQCFSVTLHFWKVCLRDSNLSGRTPWFHVVLGLVGRRIIFVFQVFIYSVPHVGVWECAPPFFLPFLPRLTLFPLVFPEVSTPDRGGFTLRVSFLFSPLPVSPFFPPQRRP